jgi:hypothetical protein
VSQMGPKSDIPARQSNVGPTRRKPASGVGPSHASPARDRATLAMRAYHLVGPSVATKSIAQNWTSSVLS